VSAKLLLSRSHDHTRSKQDQRRQKTEKRKGVRLRGEAPRGPKNKGGEKSHLGKKKKGQVEPCPKNLLQKSKFSLKRGESQARDNVNRAGE